MCLELEVMPKRGTPYRLPIIYQNDVTPRGGSLTNTRRSISDRSATLSPPPLWKLVVQYFPLSNYPPPTS